MLPLWLIPLAPLFAAVLAGILALTRRAEKTAPFLTTLATILSGCVALLAGFDGQRELVVEQHHTWLTIPPSFEIALGVQLNATAWFMVLVVCFVSALIQVYSIGYMHGEVGYARYFAYLGLFTASMLGLVVADNLFQLYVCWELVGICSYLLIGFWWSKPSAANAAKKAFVVTRFGDVGFMLGVLLLATTAGSFQFDVVEQTVRDIAEGRVASLPFVASHTFLWLAPLLLFCGAVGKSAQFPLHVWLPDAMEGPTPVSALIHAATMVAAGVYMVGRLFPLFSHSEIAMNTVLLIGALTALLAATIALVQTDIKKVLAYSTVSQLGYMMLGLGAYSHFAGMFHLVTHAMFKALLFLTAGSVIHALHHADDPNDLRQMGGLLKRMPITAITCAIGVLALAGMPPLSGFWSKDAILGAVMERSKATPALIGLLTGILVAGLTAFYATRLWLMTFWGRSRSEAAAHARESPPVMTVPLWLLAIPSLGLGYYLHATGIAARYLTGPVPIVSEKMHLELVLATSLVGLAGIVIACRLYARPQATDPVQKMPGYRFFANLWYIDAFWNAVGARGTLLVGSLVAWFDRHIVDGMMN
ncbi:MAG TPA: NADH-quinone oxidoreductase subunit L, partial [Chthonomonadales bacterium]|nr:NADH-quinone oxidoreductase subunit L [Chthonomonadales bacterium]